MREKRTVKDVDLVAAAKACHGGGEVTETVKRGYGGFFEVADEESACKVCEMVFDIVKLDFFIAGAADFGEGLLNEFRDIGDVGAIFETLLGEARDVHNIADGVADFGHEVRFAVTGNGDVGDVGWLGAGDAETFEDGEFRKAREMLDAIDAALQQWRR